ncbi:MAG: TolC family protein [Acidobacteria bacterium]|nr:TolC family protein [Acidobacteriota bacterium]
MRQPLVRVCRAAAAAALTGALSLPAAAQSGSSLAAAVEAQAAQAASSPGAARRLSIDDAQKLALEQNLGIRIQRFDPQIQDLGIMQARSLWTPQVSSTLSRRAQTQASTSSIAGSATAVVESRFTGGINLSQALPWGGSYSATWNGARSTTTNLFSTFSPQIFSNVNIQYTQPLLRNFSIDSIRQQVAASRSARELSGIQLDALVVQTLRNVKNAWWDLAYALDNLRAQQESLDLANRSLRDNQKRVEIGTMAPIDIVQAQAEVASNEERVIVAEAAIRRAQDNLRVLVLDPAAPDFWTTTFEPADTAPFADQAIDLDAAVRNALEKRSDLRSARTGLERRNVDLRYLRNQSLPDINAQATYVGTGVGGLQLSPLTQSDILSGNTTRRVLSDRSFGAAMGDIFQTDYPDWTVGVQIVYPLASNTAHANLARARLEQQQAIAQLTSLEMMAAAQVRESARNVETNRKRVGSARASRELQERKLEAEERKLAAGMSSSFFVFQAQRDLALARTAEIQAISDYNKSLVDFEAVQLAPLGGGSGGQAAASQAVR